MKSGDAPIVDLSVIVPVVDRPALLVEALASVAAATVPVRELIVVVDDADHSAQSDARAARAWAEDLPAHTKFRLLFTNRRRAGAAHARNVGIAAASSAWISFLDSDDLHHPQKAERQMRYLEQRPHLLGCQTLEQWQSKGCLLPQPQRLLPRPGRFLRDSFRHCLVSCSAVILHRQVFEELGGLDESFPACEDFDFWIRYLLRYPMGLLPEALITKRSGDWSQLSRDSHSLDALRIRALLKQLEAGNLTGGDLAAAKAAAHEKLAILERGADKHGSRAPVDQLRARVSAACWR